MITRGVTVLPKIAGNAVRWPMLVTDITEDRSKQPVAVCFWLSAAGEPNWIELACDLLELYE